MPIVARANAGVVDVRAGRIPVPVWGAPGAVPNDQLPSLACVDQGHPFLAGDVAETGGDGVWGEGGELDGDLISAEALQVLVPNAAERELVVDNSIGEGDGRQRHGCPPVATKREGDDVRMADPHAATAILA